MAEIPKEELIKEIDFLMKKKLTMLDVIEIYRLTKSLAGQYEEPRPPF